MGANARIRTFRALGSLGFLVVLGLGIWLAYGRLSQPHLIPVPLVRQATAYTCGVAALESILGYYGQDWREDKLAREVKAHPEEGTDYHEIVRFAREHGLEVDVFENMTLERLRESVEAGYPVVVAIQAWGDHPEKYAEGWDDGHYSIVIGLDRQRVYLMDPSTIGNYTYIPVDQFMERWHDYYLDGENRRINLIHFGMVFRPKAGPAFQPSKLRPLE
jgi:predicted double-glycine peptidase